MNNPMILASVKEDFYLNFIKDDRYLWLLDGLKTTLIITVFAVIVGLIIGFLVAIIRSAHDKSGSFKILNAICRVYLTVIRGTPTMIQLLIMNFVNEFIVLIKETSIIGYIGMMDLTKGAMLIQSRTYNAFWPLMAAAAIYLVIVGILTWGMNKLERRLRTSER